MPRKHPHELRTRAAEMRRAGVPRNRIARELDVGFSTVCRWFREDGVPATLQPRGRDRARQQAVRERWAFEDAEEQEWSASVPPLSSADLDLVVATLYWAEGTKSKPWRRSHRVVLCNMDPDVVRLFLCWLESVGVPRRDVLLRVAIHESADAVAAEVWWRQVVGEGYGWGRPTMKRHNPVTRRRHVDDDYVGVLTVRVARSAELYRRLSGTWRGIARQVPATPTNVGILSPVV